MAAPATSAMSATSFPARFCASATARRNQAGTGAVGTVEGAPASGAWWRERDLGRRIIETTMNQRGAFGNSFNHQPPRLSWRQND
jgi:hypothetical protein